MNSNQMSSATVDSDQRSGGFVKQAAGRFPVLGTDRILRVQISSDVKAGERESCAGWRKDQSPSICTVRIHEDSISQSCAPMTSAWLRMGYRPQTCSALPCGAGTSRSLTLIGGYNFPDTVLHEICTSCSVG